MKSKFDPKKHHRKSIRLKEYDYSQAGAYYVTIVTFQRECLFGEIVNGEMKLSPYGEIVQKWWNEILNHFSNVETGTFVIMPNHVHGIIFITERRGAVLAPRDNPNFNKMESPKLDNEFLEHNETMKQDVSMKLGGETPPLPTPTLGQIVAYFKYQSTKEMNILDNKGVVTKFWQRNYYEHIIRNEQDLKNKTDYIEANPMLWDEDDENPING
jgi:REP element-mobilizing transposase RayT